MSNYSSAAEVLAFTRHLLDGQSTFNSTTRPTGTDVTTFLGRACGVLDTALAGAGFATPITQATAKLACDDWVTQRATEYVELTQRGVGYSEGEGSRASAFRNLSGAAKKFVEDNALGFKRLGATVTTGLSAGLAFTGTTAQAYRTDPDDTTLEQPLFTRRQWDDTGTEDE